MHPEVMEYGKTLIMGILNCTPDSFSDGGQFMDAGKAVEHALRMAADGADIIDIGGESTRPGYVPVDDEEEMSRILPVIRRLRSDGLVMSVDTTKPAVAVKACECGCSILNDISGDLRSSGMADIAAANGSYLVIMFNCRVNGECEGDIITRAAREIDDNIETALSRGVNEDRIWIDPGIGFGTTRQQDVELTRNLSELSQGGRFKILYAASRKRIVKDLCDYGDDGELRDLVSDSLALTARANGASIIRSHRIRELRTMLDTYDRINGR
ncbi:dihydropteroate synthase [Ruminococcaceae bacterium YRB3002]|nr:dihydropteroate synthase [Ruminococcaceae bacterium YRB3002]